MLFWCFGMSIRTGLSTLDSIHSNPMLFLALCYPSQKCQKEKAENRTFLDRWEAEYLFTYVKDTLVCHVCGATVAITKEYNIRRHYEMKHQ